MMTAAPPRSASEPTARQIRTVRADAMHTFLEEHMRIWSYERSRGGGLVRVLHPRYASLTWEKAAMARGSKKSYSSKQKRTASHIEKSAKRSGKSSARAKQIAWATVNKQDHGGKKSGGGRGKKSSRASSRKGGRNSHRS